VDSAARQLANQLWRKGFFDGHGRLFGMSIQAFERDESGTFQTLHCHLAREAQRRILRAFFGALCHRLSKPLYIGVISPTHPLYSRPGPIPTLDQGAVLAGGGLGNVTGGSLWNDR
jgi:hypothetical protein